MAQKCPICKCMVPTDGFMPGETVTCPDCGTGIVVDPQLPGAAARGKAIQDAEPQASGKGRSAYGSAKAQVNSAVGSYSFKFGDKKAPAERVFDPKAGSSSRATPPRPEAAPSAGRQAAVRPEQPKPDPKAAAAADFFSRPAEGGWNPFQGAPKAAPVEKKQSVDPDMTIGFGDGADFEFKRPDDSRRPDNDTVKQAPVDSFNFFDPQPQASQSAQPAPRQDSGDLGFDLDAVLGSDVASGIGAPSQADPFGWGGDIQHGNPPGVPQEDVWTTAETVPLSVDHLGRNDFGGTGDFGDAADFDESVSSQLDGGQDGIDPNQLLSDDFDLKGGLMADLIYDVPPDEAAPLKALAVDAPGKGSKARARAGRSQRKTTATPQRRRLGRILIIPLVVVLIGAILGLTDYGYFGINLLSGGAKPSNSYYKTIKSDIVVVNDSREAFIERIATLERLYRDDDSDDNLVELVLTMNRYKERYPSAFSSDSRMTARLDQLKQLAAGKDARTGNMTKVMDLVGQGKYTEARAMLDSMVASSAQDVDVLYYYGKIALATDKPDEAQKYFELALIKNPGLISAKYFLAQAFWNQKKTVEAKALLSEIMAKEATHLPSRILSATIALDESSVDEAANLAQHVIAAGTPGSDTEEIFQAHRIMARVHLLGGKPAERLASLRAALLLKPAHEETAVEAGEILLRTGKRGEALDALTPCREHGCVSLAFLLVFAQAAYADDKVDVARAAIAQGEQRYPESPRFGVIEGSYHLRERRFRSAEDALEKSIKLDPKHVEAYLLISDAFMEEGMADNAASYLEKGLAQIGPEARLLIKLADIRIARKELPEAEAALRQAVQIDQNSDSAQLKLGMVVKDQGRNDEAASILNVLEKRRALDFNGSVALAEAYLEMKNFERARDILQQLYSANPDSPEAGNAFGRALGEGREYQKAIEVLSRVETRFPNNSRAPYLLGNVLMAQGKFQDAINSFEKAIKLDFSRHEYRLAASAAYIALGSVDSDVEARKHLDLIITDYQSGKIAPEDQNPEAYLMRGRILFSRQKYGQAMKDFEAALSLAPSRRDIMVEFGRSLFEMQRYDDATAYFKQVLASDSLNPVANYFMGRIHLRDGDTDTAQKFLTNAVKRNPGMFADAHKLLGFIYKDKGLRSLARDSFKAFLKHTKDRQAADAKEITRILEKGSY